MKNFKNYEFKLFNGETFFFKKLNNTFIPTATTNYLLKAIFRNKLISGDTLDLGSGIGILGLILLKKNLISGKLYASDISDNSIISLIQNSKDMFLDVEARIGSLFDTWKDYKFNNIINDVSGISSRVAKFSPWFKNVACETGEDGTLLTVKILEEASKYLNRNGLIYFPIISLSNENKILNSAKKNFKNLKLIEKNDWPLPKGMYSFLGELYQMKKDKLIDFKEKFGMIIISTSIYVAHN